MNNFLFTAKPINEPQFGFDVPHDGLVAAIYDSFSEYEYERGLSEIALSNVYENYIMNTSQSTEQKIAIFEGVVGNIFEKIKEFFKKIAEKVKAWAKAAIRWFQSYWQNDEDFIKKYEDELNKAELSNFKYYGYEWPGAAKIKELVKVVTTIANEGLEGVKEGIKDLGQNKSKLTADQAKNKGDTVTSKGIERARKDERKELGSRITKEISQIMGVPVKSGLSDNIIPSYVRGKKLEGAKGLPSGMTVSGLIESLKNRKDIESDLDEMSSAISDAADQISNLVDSAVDGLMKDVDDPTGAYRQYFIKSLRASSEIAKVYIDKSSQCADLYKKLVAEYMSGARHTLGAILRHQKVSKESWSWSY